MIRPQLRHAILVGGLTLAATAPAAVRAQGQAPAPAQAPQPAADPVAAIDAAFTQGVLKLEVQRLDQLARAAAALPPAQAEAVWLAYFRAALIGGHYSHAEKFAEQVVATPKAHPELQYLANVANILAEVERNAYDESLQSLDKAIAASKKAGDNGQAPAAATLPLETRIAVLEVYYQKLVAAGRYDVARKAFEMIKAASPDANVQAFADDRLAHLALVGQPAPAIVGKDVDGKPFDLAKLQGKVVLVVFWASWCLPSAPQAVRLSEFYKANAANGFEVVGVNLDTLQEGSEDPAAVLPDVRRFLVQHNVRWPNLINGQGPQDYAGAYRVTEVPASIVIGRDGKVEQLDLAGPALEAALTRALGR